VQSVKALPDIKVINVYDRTFNLHRGGKISIVSRITIKTVSDLAMAYTPGVGRICHAIAQNPEEVYNLTIKKNTVAIVTDGSAVLGLGNLGAAAALPVMEGKAMLFKERYILEFNKMQKALTNLLIHKQTEEYKKIRIE
jgi:malate dehydrogenase (oxaloacetate-decarboxylating)